MGELARRPTGAPMLGWCPDCEAPIPTGQLLIEYETSRGWPQMFAECPACTKVVHPQ